MKTLITLIILLAPSLVFGQFTVNYNQSSLPFFGMSYEIKDKLRPEVRIGMNTFFDDASIEGVLTYDVLNKDEYEFYAGAGVRTGNFTGLVIPLGFNFYPWTTKNFGFQFELAPIIGDQDILRGSLGIRYRFRNVQADE